MRTGASVNLEESDVIVIGAGPAGLAVAASLRRAAIASVVLERGDEVATRWRSYYSRLHLNTTKRLSRLPGLSFDRHDARWPSRLQVIRYLERFAEHHQIRPWFGVEALRVDDAQDHLSVTTSNGTLRARAVVVATGQSERPHIPQWPGRDSFVKPIVHVSRYTDASTYRDKDVLVVGAGDSGSDVVIDLVEGGARRVWLSVRTPPHVVRRQLLGIPADVTAALVSKLPPKLVDPVLGRLTRLVVGDLSRYGLPPPQQGMYAHHLYQRRAPIVDSGDFVRALREGQIEVVASVKGFEQEAVILSDGLRLSPDTVIAATGFSPGLEPMVGHLGVLATDGYPSRHAPDASPGSLQLYFLGFRYPFAGNFRQIRIDAPKLARRLAKVTR